MARISGNWHQWTGTATSQQQRQQKFQQSSSKSGANAPISTSEQKISLYHIFNGKVEGCVIKTDWFVSLQQFLLLLRTFSPGCTPSRHAQCVDPPAVTVRRKVDESVVKMNCQTSGHLIVKVQAGCFWWFPAACRSVLERPAGRVWQ